MAMTLQIIDGPGDLLKTETTKVFNEDGGTIGRAPDCDWILPDPECFVSGSHASILCQNGEYYLIDTSSNGTYVNNMPQPIPTGEPRLLTDEDQIAFGSYKVEVSLKQKDAQRAQDNSFDISTILIDDNTLGAAKAEQIAAQTSVETITTSDDESEPTGSWAMLDLDELEQAADGDESDSDSETHRSGKENDTGSKTGQYEVASDTAISALAIAETSSSKIPPRERAVASASRTTRSASVTELNPAHAVHTQSNAVPNLMEAGVDIDPMIEAFAKGAGINAGEMPNRPPVEVMEDVGRLFVEMIAGLQQLLQSRAALKDQFKLDQTIMQANSNNPIKFSSGVADSLPRLLAGKKGNYKKSANAVRECYHDINADQEAMNEAMRRALFAYLKMLDPDALEEQFEQVMGKNKFLGGNKRRYWDLYGDNYRTITQHHEGQLPDGYARAFVNAFENAVAKRGYKTKSDIK